jgi:hypothetical protein
VRFEGSGKILRVGAESRKVNLSVTTAIRFWTFVSTGAKLMSGVQANQAVCPQNVGRSSQEVLDEGSFFQELGHRSIDLVTAEIVQLNIWHDFPSGAGGTDRE